MPMKFRTELHCKPLPHPITHHDRIVTLGSCFANEVGGWLRDHKFRVVSNPTGPLFNPCSIFGLIERALDRRPYTTDELACNTVGEYILYDHSTAFSTTNSAALLSQANQQQEAIHEALTKADHLLLTFGTAWIYRLRSTGEIVANCHKQPTHFFDRERLGVEQIVEGFKRIAERIGNKQIILTVSPIRHLGDGLEGNAVSKSILRLAAELCAEQCAKAHYFPSYELLLDDLRDYRFYGDDLCHPAPQAIAYICEHFAEAAFTPATRTLNKEIERFLSFANHRPRQSHSEAYRKATEEIIAQMEATKIDFSTEIAMLKARL